MRPFRPTANVRRAYLTAGCLGIAIAVAPAAQIAPKGHDGTQAALRQIQFRGGAATTVQMSPREAADTVAALSDAGVRHVVVQFAVPVTVTERQSLSDAGLNLLAYLGDNGFFAGAAAGGVDRDRLAASRTLAYAGPIDASFKLHPTLLAGQVVDWSVVPKGSGLDPAEAAKLDPDAVLIVAAYVVFHPDVPLRDGEQLAGLYGAKVRSRLESINALVIELPYDNVFTLADEDAVQWIEPPLPTFSEMNDSNRARVGVETVWQPPYDLDGSGVTVMVYDGGNALASHQDFGGRLTAHDNCGTSDHSTHVSGTIGGDGAGSGGTYAGMAPGVTIESYAFEQPQLGCGLQEGFLYTDPGDLEDNYSEAIGVFGAHIANNSIGTNTAPNGFPCEWTGDYGVTSNLIDTIVRGDGSNPLFTEPFRVIWANGNERQTTRCGNLYFTTAPPACAKNHITVGALNSNDDSVTSFTSWGPSDDGRLKPDISGPGCQSDGDNTVTSCSSSGGYTGKCGTSMACPTVTGLSALLIQDFRQQYPGMPDPRNSTLKVLFAQTAEDIINPGPDYQTGYGSVRVQPAVDLLRAGNFAEAEVSQGETHQLIVIVNPGDPELKVTLAWDDVPGTPNVSPSLVNDLDLRVLDAGSTTFFPWTLDPGNPGSDAVRTQADHVNNLEQVVIDNPTPGAYRVEIVGFNVPVGPQSFSVAASPILVNCSSHGVAALNSSEYACASTVTIQVVDCDLNTDDGIVDTVDVNIASDSERFGETVTLTETAPAAATFLGSIPLATTDAAGTLLIAEGDQVTATYTDADDGEGGIDVPVAVSATVDCTPPVVSNVQFSDFQFHSVVVSFDTDEPATATVRYGLECGNLTGQADSGGLQTSHSLLLEGLGDGVNYFLAIDVADLAGNAATDDNGGICHTFATPPEPTLSVPFFEPFGDTSFDPDTWQAVENATIDGVGISPPSAPLSARFNGDPSGGDLIQSWPFDLSAKSAVRLSYAWQRRGGGESPDTNDDLYIEYLNDSQQWQQIGFHPGSGADMTTFQTEDVLLPADALHDDFRLRIRNTASTGAFDDWFVDDVTLTNANAPEAFDAAYATPIGTDVLATLLANDPNGDPLALIIDSLPTRGRLSDAVTREPVFAAPYTLSGGDEMVYTPFFGFAGNDAFTFHADDGTHISNVATISVTVGAGVPAYSFPLDSDPGWGVQGQWAFGQPTGGGTPPEVDPTSGFTGPNVYGYNLAGDYPNNMATTQYLTTTAIDCSNLFDTELRFYRWLGIESSSFDHANLQVSNNGSTWTTVWEHVGPSFNETSWSQQALDISAVADDQPTVFLRWGMGPTDGSVTFPGWNIDDVEIFGITPTDTRADMNCDGTIDAEDIDPFFVAQGDVSVYAMAFPFCNPANADVNNDDAIDAEDIDPFFTCLAGGFCP